MKKSIKNLGGAVSTDEDGNIVITLPAKFAEKAGLGDGFYLTAVRGQKNIRKFIADPPEEADYDFSDDSNGAILLTF